MTSVLHFSFFNMFCDHLCICNCNDQVFYSFYTFQCTHPSVYSHIDELVTFPYAENDRRVGRLFCATMRSLMKGQ